MPAAALGTRCASPTARAVWQLKQREETLAVGNSERRSAFSLRLACPLSGNIWPTICLLPPDLDHRACPRTAVIQGGDFTRGDGTGGESIYGEKFAGGWREAPVARIGRFAPQGPAAPPLDPSRHALCTRPPNRATP